MQNTVYCFSGTGNSLSVAKDIAERLGDTSVVLVADVINERQIALASERVGFVCPAYFGSLPPIMERLVAKLDFRQTQYVFAVITAGAIHGSSFDSLAGLIAERGGQLNARFPVQMPGNYIAMYGAWPAPIQRYLLKKAKQKTARIAECIKEKRSTPAGRASSRTPRRLTDRMSGYEQFAEDYRVTDKCTGCETCAKICPTRNITMVDGRPQFGANCEHCMACLQWCPAEAIDYKTATAKRRRYHHPDVKASDLYPKA